MQPKDPTLCRISLALCTKKSSCSEARPGEGERLRRGLPAQRLQSRDLCVCGTSACVYLLVWVYVCFKV